VPAATYGKSVKTKMISPPANKTKKLKTRNICAGNLIRNETDICKTRLEPPTGICFANNERKPK
jgi:hypothetical protein